MSPLLLIYRPSQPQHVLVEGSRTHHAGAIFTVDDERGRSLLAQLHPDVDDGAEALEALSRGELDGRAAKLGVKAPAKLGSKQAVIKAITAAVEKG